MTPQALLRMSGQKPRAILFPSGKSSAPLLEDLEHDGVHMEGLQEEEMVGEDHVPQEEGDGEKPEETGDKERKRQWGEDESEEVGEAACKKS